MEPRFVGAKYYWFLFSFPYEFCTRDDGCLDYSFSDTYIHIGKNENFLEAINLLF